MNWADDVNYMFTSISSARLAIKKLIQISEDLELPFSKSKCKLVPMYPKGFKQRDKEKYGEEIDGLVKISKEAKILGVTWSQPRFYKG